MAGPRADVQRTVGWVQAAQLPSVTDLWAERCVASGAFVPHVSRLPRALLGIGYEQFDRGHRPAH